MSVASGLGSGIGRAGRFAKRETLPEAPVVIELFVPGRLCLFGEHSDWAAGYRGSHPEIPEGRCLVTGTEQGLRARARRADGRVEIESWLGRRREGPWRVSADPEALAAEAVGGGFFSYAAGTALEILARHRVAGLRLEVRSDLPPGRGLSSSAALCVLVARACSRLYDLDLSLREEMEIAYRGERRTGSECGRMDQICARGRRPTLLAFDGDGWRLEPVEPGGSFHLLIVDLRRGKDTRRILSDLNACFPDAPGEVAAGVREALGERNHGILERARQQLVAGDAEGLGELMREAQALFFEQVAPACPELEAPRLREVLAHPAVRELAWGGKGVGSQGDGCAQLVTRGPEAREHLTRRLESELGVACLPLSL